MPKKYLFAPVLSLLLSLLWAGNQSFAQVVADKTSGCAPLLVNFTGPAGTWDFGDGNPPVPTPANPGRQYLRPGTFTVRAPYCSTVSIVVYAKPQPQFAITRV